MFPKHYIDAINDCVDNNYFTPIWEEVYSFVEPHILLDVGCGNGIFSMQVKKRTGCKLVGVDSSDYALKQAELNGFDQTYHISDLSVDLLPFFDEQFQIVFCKDVLEHLLDPCHLLNEITRVTARGGLILISVPNHFSLYGRLKFLFTNSIDTFNFFPGSKCWNFPHIRFFTYNELCELFNEMNLEVVRNFSSAFFSFPCLRLIPFKRELARCLVGFSPSNFAGGFTFLLKKM